MGELVSCSSHRRGRERVKLQEAGSCVINDRIVPYLNTMTIVGNAAVVDFAKGVETEISRMNENAAKRGK